MFSKTIRCSSTSLIIAGVFLSGCNLNDGQSVDFGNIDQSGTVPVYVNLNIASQIIQGSSIGFSFCVDKILMVDAFGALIHAQVGIPLTFEPGLIDLSSGSAMTWGKVSVPQGVQVKVMTLGLDLNTDLCQGIGYSVNFNGIQTQDAISLNIRFDSPQPAGEGSELQFDVSPILQSLQTASADSSFTGTQLKGIIESITLNGTQ